MTASAAGEAVLPGARLPGRLYRSIAVRCGTVYTFRRRHSVRPGSRNAVLYRARLLTAQFIVPCRGTAVLLQDITLTTFAHNLTLEVSEH